MLSRNAIPLWLKIVYTLWLALWVTVYWQAYGAQNFLWLCDAANLILGLAIWLESPLLFSSQAVGVLIIQALWIVDVCGRLLSGVHLIGGTEYMFDPEKSIGLRSLSLFHIVVPILLLWAIRRLGYDRRGWKLQTVILWLLLPFTYLVTDPELNINWLWKPFGVNQTLLPELVYLGVVMLAVPLVLYLPTHAALLAWTSRQRPKVASPA
ncbi:MAG: hypothetical protein GY769_14025 [bacterium]|nr:hypothetical protein [bacterium]